MELDNPEVVVGVLGQYDRNLRLIAKEFPNARIVARGNRIVVEGDDKEVERLQVLFEKLAEAAQSKHPPSLEEIKYLVNQVKEGGELDGVLTDIIQITHWGEAIRPKTEGQRRYIKAIHESDVVFAIGPAGTGKTYLAVACAIDYLKKGRVKRIVLTRPAVEAGEELGFLPGDILQKVHPYLRPLYDAIY
ncbi:TPA: PhoH family protein, partial [Candidatus Micrarchaeota archaeon]|nr:PhoH family protein [Candidatus Micrarchaeota archaeon]